MKELNVYIGYDAKESISWHVLVQSLMQTSSMPLNIKPVNLQNYTGIYERQHDHRQSNEFSFSRFLVPYLMDYSGLALFLDCDMLVRSDIKEIFDLALSNSDKAVHVVKHDYTPANDVKYLGKKQYAYPRKNWSSVVLWNCSHPKNQKLDLNFVNKSSGAELHRFTWLADDEIGELDLSWNWLVGEYDLQLLKKPVKNVHWTVGGPYFNEYANVDFSEEWFKMKDITIRCDQLGEI
jgi:lipopolysaccharide biosynthesis glycosyltransferase